MPFGGRRQASVRLPCAGRQVPGDTEKAKGAGRVAPGISSLPNAPRRALRGCSGFTLLEVMVAVAILAMVLVTLLGVQNRSTEDVLLADHMTTATLLAKRTMADLLQNPLRPKEGEEKGDFPEDEFKEYSWIKKITPVPLQNENISVTISELRVQVLWKEGTRQEMVELLSYD